MASQRMKMLDSEETSIDCWKLEETMLYILLIDVSLTVDRFHPALCLHPRTLPAALETLEWKEASSVAGAHE